MSSDLYQIKNTIELERTLDKESLDYHAVILDMQAELIRHFVPEKHQKELEGLMEKARIKYQPTQTEIDRRKALDLDLGALPESIQVEQDEKDEDGQST